MKTVKENLRGLDNIIGNDQEGRKCLFKKDGKEGNVYLFLFFCVTLYNVGISIIVHCTYCVIRLATCFLNFIFRSRHPWPPKPSFRKMKFYSCFTIESRILFDRHVCNLSIKQTDFILF